MSLAKIKAPRRRTLKLRVVGGDLAGRPRHRSFSHVSRFLEAGYVGVEFWTIEEWAKLASWERPEKFSDLPGVGYVALTAIQAKECDEINEEILQAREDAKLADEYRNGAFD